MIIYLICQNTGWHQKATPVLGCFSKHTIQKETNRLTVQDQNNYTEQLKNKTMQHSDITKPITNKQS